MAETVTANETQMTAKLRGARLALALFFVENAVTRYSHPSSS